MPKKLYGRRINFTESQNFGARLFAQYENTRVLRGELQDQIEKLQQKLRNYFDYFYKHIIDKENF